VRIRKPNRTPGQDLRDLPTYSIPEAATFLAIPARTLSYWFSGKYRIFHPAGDYEKYSLLSFKDVVEAYMLYVLRKFHNFSSLSIKRSLENLRKETKSQHPLFDLDIRVFANGLLLDRPAHGKRGREVVNLSRHRQLAFGDVTDIFSERILQDKQGQPLQVFPWRDFQTDHVSRPVSIDPEVLSGRLVVTGTRIPVSVLLGLKRAQTPPEEIAKNYRLDVETVEKALRHVEKPLQKVA
jgi:uncharacterized protein (DUF433 family)